MAQGRPPRSPEPTKEYMSPIVPISLCVIALLGWAAPARAADPLVDTSVVAVPGIVTVSRPTDTPPSVFFAGYELRIVNNSKNTLNHVRFVAHTVVKVPNPLVAGAYIPLAGAAAPFAEAIGASCLPVAGNPSAINCELGTLRGRGGTTATTPITLLFRSPAAGAIIELSWQGFYAEGSRDSSGASHGDGTDVGTTTTTLGTPTSLEVKTYVPTGGGSFFTGAGVATKLDQWTTTVSVPRSTVAEVVEAISAQSCGAEYNICVSSALRIPGEFAYLEVKLRRDVSTLVTQTDKLGNVTRPNIANALLYYQAETFNATQGWQPGGAPVPINACNALTGLPNGTERRCIFSRQEYNVTTAPTFEWKGDWEFVVRALENGRIAW